MKVTPFFLLFLLFLGLKLAGIITWSWWWVTAPLWGALALILVVLVCMGIGWLFVRALFGARQSNGWPRR